SGQYPDKKTRHKWEGKFEFKKGEPPVSSGTEAIYGYIFTSADQKQIFQARIDGFTFSRLKPYETWEQLRDEAHRVWQLYGGVVSTEITRVALRYINRMEFPLPIRDFSDYLTAAPIVPAGLPQGVSSFLTRVVIHEPEIDAAAIITQALEQVVNPSILPIILDIDVFKQKSEGISEEDAWDTLDKLRHFKNKIFFESITEKAKELFL
ncbi:MAG: TIGR04255 family protein, partial [Spirochaetota bacterium]